MNKVIVIMLANTASEYFRNMTDNALNSMWQHKGENELRCVLVETNVNSEPYKQDFVHTVYPNEGFKYNRFLNIGYETGGNFFWPEFFAENKEGETYVPKYVIVANNDLIFHENWASEIISAMEDNEDLDSVSPLNPGWIYHNDINEEWRIHRGWDIGRHFCGWLQMYRKESWDRLFPLDERFSFWAQDNDIAIRMSKMGMVHALVSTAKVTHLTSRSHSLIPHDKHHHFTHGMGEVLHKKINDGEYDR